MSISKTQYTELDVLQGTATSTAAAATVNTQAGTITTEALTTAAAASYTFTLTNALIKVGSQIFASASKGTATAGGLALSYATPAAGSAVLIFTNPTAAAVNGTVLLNFFVLNTA